MPNAKLYIDDRALARIAEGIEPALGDLRQALCQVFSVTEPACHLVIIPVKALAGQTPVNVELTILHKADRTREAVEAACLRLQALVERLFGLRAAIRCTMMQPENYVVMK